MKALLFSLLVTSLSVELGSPLQCYSCLNRTPISKCTEVKNCSDEATDCMMTRYTPDAGYPFKNESDVISDCAVDCKPTLPTQIGTKYPVNCCKTNLCNDKNLIRSRGALSVHTDYALLASYATFISIFLHVGLH